MTNDERKRIYDLLLMGKITLADAIERLTDDEPDESLPPTYNCRCVMVPIGFIDVAAAWAVHEMEMAIAYNYGQWAAMSHGMGNPFYRSYEQTDMWLAGVWRNRCEN